MTNDTLTITLKFKGPLTPQQAHSIAATLVEGLEEAHNDCDKVEGFELPELSDYDFLTT
jgi:hypothetical protein